MPELGGASRVWLNWVKPWRGDHAAHVAALGEPAWSTPALKALPR